MKKPSSKPRRRSKRINTLSVVGDTASKPNHVPLMSKMQYNKNSLVECELKLEDLTNFKREKGTLLWINVHGVHHADLLYKIGEIFKLHPLVVEDILNTEQRPKVDEFDDYLFMETRAFYYHRETLSASSEQISLVLGRDFLLTFQERSTGTFEAVRERLRASHAHMRELGVDYLAYALLDSVVDRYFGVLEDVSNDSEDLEDLIMVKATNAELHSIHKLKHVSIELRRSVWPLREAINSLVHNDKGFFKPETMPYLRDVYDHTVSFIESLESIRDTLGGMMDIYMASVSQKVNLELRALTVVAMLFMPATLIAGVFGMNTKWLPWQNEVDGFWFVMAMMVGIGALMGIIFWRRQWINRSTFSIRKLDN